MIPISIIIPAFNRAGLIRATLDSVIDAPRTQVIVVDDGSTDDTVAIVESYGPRVTLLKQQNRGPGAARNLGLTVATGEYVAFLDSDDVWFPWTIDLYRQAILDYGRPRFVVGKPFIFEGQLPTPDAVVDGPSKELRANVFLDYFKSGDQWRWYSASSFLMYRHDFVAAGGFTDDWVNAEDADAALRMGNAPGFVQITSPPTFGYRKHPGSAMSNIDRTLAGITRLVDQESAGKFPGGDTRSLERRRIICTYVRPLVLELLSRGRKDQAWKLYRRTFWWHLVLDRRKFLVGFPLRALVQMVRPSQNPAGR